jgi:hypothetical protein
VTRKVVKLATPVTAPQGLSVPAEYRFSIYPANNSPAAIIRNEELLLLRAEANLALGNTAATLQDVNTVRTVSGGLAPLTELPAVPLDAIVYEKRMSMLLEGLRWEDMRRWGRLSQLPVDLPTHFVARVMPIPQAECDARPTKPRGCEGNL